MFREQLDRYALLVEEHLEQLSFGKGLIHESMRYSLIGGGKRIRPVLALASAEVVGGSVRALLPAACALELIHTYSLIHDDLPAMDNDDYRRGRLANHKYFGEGIAILAGDGLLTYAFELLAQPLPHIAPLAQLQVIREVARAAGPYGMVAGQVADLQAEGKPLTLLELETIHQQKTGALLMAAARLGGILGGGGEGELSALTAYARDIGLAFQIKDDVLDLESDSETLGKPAQSDMRQNKSTYPSLLGMEGAKAELAAKVAQAHASLEMFGDRGQFLHALADYIAQRKN